MYTRSVPTLATVPVLRRYEEHCPPHLRRQFRKSVRFTRLQTGIVVVREDFPSLIDPAVLDTPSPFSDVTCRFLQLMSSHHLAYVFTEKPPDFLFSRYLRQVGQIPQRIRDLYVWCRLVE